MKKFVLTIIIIFTICSNFALAQQENQIEQTNKDLVTYSENGKLGLKTKQDEIIVEAKYKKLIRLGEQSWIIQKGNRFGIMDSQGNIVVEPKYRHIERVFIKYAKLGNDNDYGLYDQTGKAIIPPEYSSIEPLFGQKFLTCKNYRYGITDINGKVLLPNDFDDIYMPNPHSLRISFEGEWFEIEKLTADDISLPEGVNKIKIDEEEFKITKLVTTTGVISGYSALTISDYLLKIFSTISPAYEQTIDDLMFSQGAEGVTIFVKFAWLPKFPFTYAKKYYQNYKNPYNGPLSEIKSDFKRKLHL